MSEPKITVIVPIHNVEQYIVDCLESIRSQTFTDFEVIMVNDATPDNSVAIAEKYVNSDSRFRLIHNDTCIGLSRTRNRAIEIARGEYIAFIDSDDRYAEQFLERMYNAITEHNADVAVCDFALYYLNTKKTKRSGNHITNNKIYGSLPALKELLHDKNFRFYVWNKLWKASLFKENNIRMTPMYYEDIVVCSQLFCHVNKVVSINYCGYYYTRAFSKYKEVSMSCKRINDYINTVPLVRSYLSKKGLYKPCKLYFNTHILHVYFSVPLLCFQARTELHQSVLRNSVSGMNRVIRCCRRPVDELTDLIKVDSVK